MYYRLFIFVLLCAFSYKSFAYDFKVDGLCYDILSESEHTVEVTYETEPIGNPAYKNIFGELFIPETVSYNNNTYKVTSIGYSAFRGCSSLTGSLKIPNSVTTIKDLAFCRCSSFTGSLIIPNSVTFIGSSAFLECSGFSSSLSIPNSVTSIGSSAFKDCSGFTGSLIIPNSVTSIENYTFWGCSGFSGSLEIPNSVTSIGEGAFYRCSGFTGSLVIPNSVTYIGDGTFYRCSGFTGSLTIPNSAKAIGKIAFEGCSGFTGSLIIPNSVTSIGGNAFRNCSGFSGSLVIPNSVISIGDYAFQGCSGLTGSLTIPNSVMLIGQYAFDNCSGFTGSLTISNSLTTIEESVFGSCHGFTGSLAIPNSVTSIKSKAFSLCSGFTGTLTIPNSVISIGNSAFSNCIGLSSIDIGSGIQSIQKSAFAYCKNVTDVYCRATEVPNTDGTTFEGSVNGQSTLHVPESSIDRYNDTVPWSQFNTIIELNDGDSSFVDPALAVEINGIYYKLDKETNSATVSNIPGYWRCYSGDIVIPQKVEYQNTEYVVNAIGDDAFKLCDGMTSCKMPNTIKSIGNESFLTCKLLTSIEIPESVESIGNFAFMYCYNLSQINLPTNIARIGSKAFDQTAWYDKIYNESEDGVIYLNKTAYSYKGTSPIKLEIEEGTLGIASGAFSANFDLYSVLLPPTLLVIGEGAFMNCSSLSSIEIPGSVETISCRTFSGCSNLYSVILHEGIKRIESYAFESCTKLETISIPSSVYFMGSFYGCKGLRSVHIKDLSAWCIMEMEGTNPLSYANRLFLNGNEILDLVIPHDICSIKDNAFSGCSLKTVQLHDGVLKIGSNAFSNCSALSTISFSKSLTDIGKFAFFGCGNLTSVVIPNSVKSIGEYAFSGCTGLLSISIPSSMTSIEPQTFEGCISLTSITIGSEIQRISRRAFGSCKNVGDVYCYAAEVPLTNGTAFEDSNIDQATLYVPESSIDIYKESFPWSGFKSVASIEGGKTYTLSITSTANGSVTYSGNTIDGTTKSFTVNEGTSATLTFTPNSNYQICSVKVDGVDVTSSVSNNQYTISNIKRSTTVEVKFEEIISSFTYHGVNCRVLSNTEKTVIIAHGDYDQALEVPASFTVNGVTWYVNGIDNDVMTDNPQLAAVIWNPAVKFDAKVSNPNFLLYVISADYAPSGIKNVIVNGTANSITLTEADGGNDFYCPKAFAARSISYTHNYSMITGVGECRGWETIALPFNVQKIAHSEKGQVVPFAVWQKGEPQRPFWLYELTGNGWKEAGAIKAYTPYVISMPNNELYYESSCLNGQVTFSAENVAVEATNSHQVSYNGKTFVPNFSVRESGGYVYALNVKNDWAAYNGSLTEGSHFVQNLRTVHPFEAYMTTENNSRAAFSIFDADATEVQGVKMLLDQRKIKGVYNLNGQKLNEDNDRNLPAGVYIIDGQKVMVK